jgi:hypothetical protein
MISLYYVFCYLVRKQKYTVLYFLLKKLLGPKLLHTSYKRPSLYSRMMTWTGWKKDYFLEAWEVV